MPDTPPSTPPATPAPAAVTPPPPPPPEPPKPPALRELIKDRLPELADGTVSDELLVKAAAAALVERGQLQAELSAARTAATRIAPAHQQEPAKQWWEQKNEYDVEWLRHVDVDPQTGFYKPKQGHPPEFADKLNQVERNKRQFGEKLTTDPASILEPFITAVVQKHLQGYSAQSQGEQAAQQFFAKNMHWMVEHVNGEPVTDPLNGRYKQTALGKHFLDLAARAPEVGIKSYPDQLAWAMGQLAMTGRLPQNPAGALPPAMTAEQLAAKQQEFNKGDLRTPSKAVPPVGATKTPDQMLKDLYKDIPGTVDALSFFRGQNLGTYTKPA